MLSSVLPSALCPPAPLKCLTFLCYTTQIIIIIIIIIVVVPRNLVFGGYRPTRRENTNSGVSRE